MRRTLTIALLLMGWLAGGIHAQIGAGRTECTGHWGTPVSDHIDTNGLGTLAFASDGLTVEFNFVNGTAQRAVYRAASLDDKAILSLLNINREGMQWQEWSLAGRKAADNGKGNRRWMRSDEMAMAELTADGLTVLGANWNRYLANPGPLAGTNQPPRDGPAVAAVTTPAPAPPRIAAMPVRKPKAPGMLPSKGDSKDNALHLLGQPVGAMVSRGREVLVYPWGNLWITNGVIARIE
jgi:hypothetical protein